ncbi:MAG: sulfatase [Pirellulaceae bacterium]
MIRKIFLGLLVVVLGNSSTLAAQPNVLFIAVDDLRPELGCYGKSHMHTPNIDQLASGGVLFERAYCMVPTCGASRAALMTSIRPTRDRFVNHLTWAEKDAADALPLHKHFKDNGYTTISLGKVFHHTADHANGWSKPAWRSKQPGYQDAQQNRQDTQENKRLWPKKAKHRGAAFESFDAPDDNYADGDCASQAIDYLTKFAKEPDQPFFLAVGFLKPHLPFNAPKKYWDMYDRETIDVPENYQIPTDVPAGAAHNSGELRAYAGIPATGPVDRETARSLIHGYYACVSFTDAQVGRLLETLRSTGLDKNTIVVLWGDHGWQLGEHGMWNKHSCFETSMHAPLLIRTPATADIAGGTRVTGLTEFIDIYPTLCELTGLAVPKHVQGSSLVNVMRDPSLPGKPFAIGRFGSGDTIRTDQWRYSAYTTPQGKLSGAMLFDHQVDPRENKNVLDEHPPTAQELAQQLDESKGR